MHIDRAEKDGLSSISTSFVSSRIAHGRMPCNRQCTRRGRTIVVDKWRDKEGANQRRDGATIFTEFLFYFRCPRVCSAVVISPFSLTNSIPIPPYRVVPANWTFITSAIVFGKLDAPVPPDTTLGTAPDFRLFRARAPCHFLQFQRRLNRARQRRGRVVEKNGGLHLGQATQSGLKNSYDDATFSSNQIDDARNQLSMYVNY